MLAIDAYHRRRAWAAWHAGAPANFKDITFDQLAGIKPEPVSVEQMEANLRRFAAAHNAALAVAEQGN